MKRMRLVVFFFLTHFSCTAADAATIPTVPVGNPGNPADTRYRHPYGGVGSVSYNFRIGKTEVTNAQYTAFLNAVAATDTYGLYSTTMDSDPSGGIVRSGVSGSFRYAVKASTVIPSGPFAGTPYAYDDKPVVYVSWGDAVRFANWLHNGQPTGAQDASTTEVGAYTLNGAVTRAALAAVTRNPGARWWLPSEDEWYKAAYHKNDGVTGNFWDYPTGSDSVPNNNPPSLDTGNSANFVSANFTMGNFSNPMTDVGAYSLSDSPYGTYDQGGNVWEWNETLFSSFLRGVRGSSWISSRVGLSAISWRNDGPAFEGFDYGFRVANIPEPAGISSCLAGGLMLLLRRGRTSHSLFFIPTTIFPPRRKLRSARPPSSSRSSTSSRAA